MLGLSPPPIGEDLADELTLRRRQARAVGRITTSEVLRELVDRGMLPAGIAAKAEARIAEEIDQIGT